jgi:thioredoxin 2
MGAVVVKCANCGYRNRVPAAATGVPRCGHCHQPLPWIADANDDTFAEIAEGASIPVVVDMWAPWCGPCRMVSPALEQVATELAGRIKLVKVNVDDSPKLQQRFNVMAIPTLMVLRRGGPVRRRPRACAPGWRRSSGTSRTRDAPAPRRREAVISGRSSD